MYILFIIFDFLMIMEKKIFKCKQFEIDDSRSALKIGSDGMMLGAWVQLEHADRILDIGTGSGLIALMQAQKYPRAYITGVDIHEGSILDATDNASKTPWSNRLHFTCSDVKTYHPEKKFDAIISNPPFFVNSTKSNNKALSTAKHTDSLSPLDIIDLCPNLLNVNGKVTMILPFDLGTEVIQYALTKGFHLTRKCIVYPVSYKKPNRLIFELKLTSEPVEYLEESIFVRDSAKNNAFSDGYKSLLSDFMIRY